MEIFLFLSGGSKSTAGCRMLGAGFGRERGIVFEGQKGQCARGHNSCSIYTWKQDAAVKNLHFSTAFFLFGVFI